MLCSAPLQSSSALCCAQDYCTNCSGPLAAPGLYGALSGVRTQGYGDEVFVKHIADHMHTVKYKATGGQKTLQELGFHYVNMDASWDLPNRSAATGELQPDPKLWPSGLDHTGIPEDMQMRMSASKLS